MCPLCVAAAASIAGTVWLWVTNLVARRRSERCCQPEEVDA